MPPMIYISVQYDLNSEPLSFRKSTSDIRPDMNTKRRGTKG